MGCCMSSTTATKGDSHDPKTPSQHLSPPKPPPLEPHRTRFTITPLPPASLEEETVKEVLSEVPIISKPPPPQTTRVTRHQNTQTPIFQQPKTLTQSFTINNNKSKKHREEKELEGKTPEISQASEICSVTDTLSTATTTTATTTTTTVTEIREDEATSKKRVNRSPAKVPRKRPYIVDRERVLKSPAKVKREVSGQVRATQQRNVGSSGVKSGVDEGLGLRPRLPENGTTSGVRRGRVGASPAKVTGKACGRSVEVGVGGGVKKEEENDGVLMQQQQENESLDNPLVSLECFIFL